MPSSTMPCSTSLLCSRHQKRPPAQVPYSVTANVQCHSSTAKTACHPEMTYAHQRGHVSCSILYTATPMRSTYKDAVRLHLLRCQWRGPRAPNSNGAAGWHANRSNRSQPSLALQHIFGCETLTYQDNCKGSSVDYRIRSAKCHEPHLERSNMALCTWTRLTSTSKHGLS